MSRSTRLSIDLSLLPNHIEDLRRSGLTDFTIQSWRCFSISPENAHLLKGFARGVTVPGLALPIFPPAAPRPAGFIYKPDSPRVITDRSGRVRTCKYECVRRGLSAIHVPLAAQWLFRTPDGREGPLRMVITEGQKKAEKAAQEGIGCVALFGVWNWLANFGGESVPIEQLVTIDWQRYCVEVCFDSDALTNPHVRRAERALAQWLRSHGAARVSIVRLPPAADGSKVALDDYLISHSAEEFEALPRQESDELELEDAVTMLSPETDKKQRAETLARILVEERDPAEQERRLKIAVKQTRISLRALRKTAETEAPALRDKRRDQQVARTLSPEDLEKEHQRQQAEVDVILNQAQSAVTLRAQTWFRGLLAYICAFDRAAVLITSAGKAANVTNLPKGITVTQPPPDRSPISPAGIRRFMTGENVEAYYIFESLRNCFARHAIFKDASVPIALAMWTMGTYIYSLFNYYGYLWFTSLGASHGKSLVEKILSLLCFNATAPETAPTAATLFRDTEANAGTLILDEIENLDPEKKGDLLALLNAGFERGGQVPRSVPVGDAWVTRRFTVYCPKAIAGISYLPRTLQTRVFAIDMPKRKEDEKIESFEPDRISEWAERMRDDQAIFVLRNTEKIAEMYVGRAELVPRSVAGVTIDDRLRDTLAPLYAMSAVIDHEAGQLVATPGLDRFAALQAGSRNSDPAAGDYAIALHAFAEWAAPRWCAGKLLIRTPEAIEIFRSAEIDWATEPAKAKSLLRKLGGQNKPDWWMGKTVRGFVFNQAEIQDLVDRHPFGTEVPVCPEEKR